MSGLWVMGAKGLYKSGTNPIEAHDVVAAAIHFMKTDAERSLGIVTLNQKQQQLIYEELEYALSRDPVAARYVETWAEKNDGLERFFVKNLENVQGDERDVIFVSTVYGPEEHGARVMQRFGPINGVTGKRRLNVLFSRAKQQIVTFSSMTPGDITAEEGGNVGAYMLKRWLEYASTGVLESGVSTDKEPDSDFETFVMDQIRAMGCEPVPQVGVKGYSIDIGIKHPLWKYGYVLGVECDGAAYHSAKSARDRDRLRQEVLEGLGWKIHRVWSTDWFNNPLKQAEILREVIQKRLSELQAKEQLFQSVRVVQPLPPPKPETSSVVASAIQTNFHFEEPPANDGKIKNYVNRVKIGDTVRVRYMDEENKVAQFTISASESNTSLGIIHRDSPMAKALLDAEEGDELELLNGSYVRTVVLESIQKPVKKAAEG